MIEFGSEIWVTGHYDIAGYSDTVEQIILVKGMLNIVRL
jgi:hypothetical protein